MLHQPAPSGRAVTQLTYLPWSSGHDFRLSLTLISAGDRGSIPRGRVLFCVLFLHSFTIYLYHLVFIILYLYLSLSNSGTLSELYKSLETMYPFIENASLVSALLYSDSLSTRTR